MGGSGSMRQETDAFGMGERLPGAAVLKKPMATIQLALQDPRAANDLKRALAGSSSCQVVCVERPDAACAGVLVVDDRSLAELPQPIANPERVVVITHDDARSLKSAWEAGVSSVVFDRDPMSTVVLAILSACLSLTNPKGTEPIIKRS
jgi:hypothetical protein